MCATRSISIGGSGVKLSLQNNQSGVQVAKGFEAGVASYDKLAPSSGSRM
jgi:hypothetical protein